MDSVMDMGSRRILGHALGEHHDTDLAYGALAMAVAVRGGSVPGVIFHTGQGSDYTARSFRQACERLDISQSMGRPGSALDNAVIESWHSTLEWELRSLRKFATKTQARAAVAAWIEDYNHERRHSSLGMVSPVDYERSLAGKEAASPPLALTRPLSGRGHHPGLKGAAHRPAGDSSTLSRAR